VVLLGVLAFGVVVVAPGVPVVVLLGLAPVGLVPKVVPQGFPLAVVLLLADRFPEVPADVVLVPVALELELAEPMAPWPAVVEPCAATVPVGLQGCEVAGEVVVAPVAAAPVVVAAPASLCGSAEPGC
jgi:hypothetical protein